MVRPRKDEKPASEKILEVACDLFYKQGYFQTGIKQIIEEANVSKATFYAQYSSKEELCLAYLRNRREVESEMLLELVEAAGDPLQRYMTYIECMEPFMLETDFRGCTFANIAVEIREADSPLIDEVRRHDDIFRDHLCRTAQELIDSDPGTYGHLDSRDVAESYYIILEGALTAAHNLRATWPLRHARKLISMLLH